ncbi:MAG: hypothetical protein EZS28_041499 [Streblomastix strix]|uniref:AB hydrolase-1 domain-containing protein n=1 Tax=Streblomastix strix TaxID=222440 RepID=A0A5J4TXD8_9EUKA|nr:MAG: hypothetical protein EZS28_041499 [Streblomastix strix]
MITELIQFPEFLNRLDQKIGPEGILAQKQKNSILQNGMFESPDEKDQFSLYYEVYGRGDKKILMICGFSGSMDEFRRFLLPMIEHPEYQVCMYNNRGIPPSQAKKFKGQTTAILAHDAHLLVKHLGWQKVNIASASMGSMIALEFASQFPDQTESMIIMCGTAGPYTPSFQTFNEKHHEYNDMTGLEFVTQSTENNPYPCIKEPILILIQQFRAILKHEV